MLSPGTRHVQDEPSRPSPPSLTGFFIANCAVLERLTKTPAYTHAFAGVRLNVSKHLRIFGAAQKTSKEFSNAAKFLFRIYLRPFFLNSFVSGESESRKLPHVPSLCCVIAGVRLVRAVRIFPAAHHPPLCPPPPACLAIWLVYFPRDVEGNNLPLTKALLHLCPWPSG